MGRLECVVEVIVRDPESVSGTPSFRGTSIRFQVLVEYLKRGETLNDFLDALPGAAFS